MMRFTYGLLFGEAMFLSSALLMGAMDWATASVVITITVTIISSLFGLFIKILSNKHVDSLKSSFKNNFREHELTFKAELKANQIQFRERVDRLEEAISSDIHRVEQKISHLDASTDARFELHGQKAMEHRLMTERNNIEITQLKEQMNRITS
jgi:hypothetical protein